jgi:hypothetical protein
MEVARPTSYNIERERLARDYFGLRLFAIPAKQAARSTERGEIQGNPAVVAAELVPSSIAIPFSRQYNPGTFANLRRLAHVLALS